MPIMCLEISVLHYVIFFVDYQVVLRISGRCSGLLDSHWTLDQEVLKCSSLADGWGQFLRGKNT